MLQPLWLLGEQKSLADHIWDEGGVSQALKPGKSENFLVAEPVGLGSAARDVFGGSKRPGDELASANYIRVL